jgi:hypothetical protein
VVQTFFDPMTARDAEGARKVMTAAGRFYVMDARKPTDAFDLIKTGEGWKIGGGHRYIAA